MNQGSLLKAALLGGVLAGIASALPLLSLLCCGWAMGGGAFAAWVLISDSGGQAPTGRCGTAGFLAGLVAGMVCAPLTGLVNQMLQGADEIESQAAQITSMMGSGADQISPEMMEAVIRGTSFIEFNLWSVFAIVFFAFIFSLFGLIGGLIGSALFGRKAAPAPIAVPPGPAHGAPPPPFQGGAPEVSGELPADELPPLPPRDEDPEA